MIQEKQSAVAFTLHINRLNVSEVNFKKMLTLLGCDRKTAVDVLEMCLKHW